VERENGSKYHGFLCYLESAPGQEKQLVVGTKVVHVSGFSQCYKDLLQQCKYKAGRVFRAYYFYRACVSFPRGSLVHRLFCLCTRDLVLFQLGVDGVHTVSLDRQTSLPCSPRLFSLQGGITRTAKAPPLFSQP